MPDPAAVLTPPAARHRPRRLGCALALAADPSGRITFELRRQDLHYWIAPRSEDERTATLEALRSLESGVGSVVVTFSITGAGIPEDGSWLEYRVLRIRRLEGALDVYAERAGAPPPPARPELDVRSRLDSALLRGVPLYLSGRLDEAVAELDGVEDAEEPEAAARWKVILAKKTRGLALAARAHGRDPRPSEDGDNDLLQALEDLRAWQRL